MKRILFIPHDLNHLGGGTGVAAWALQALVAEHQVSILNWSPADLRLVNRRFGTDLRQDDFRWFSISPLLRRALACVPLPLAHLRNQILCRRARQLNEAERFDVVFGAKDEIDVGVTAVQYVHFPWGYWPRPDADLRWYHNEALTISYRWLAAKLSDYDPARVGRNVTLTNSDWTAAVFEKCYGVRPLTVYPPVPGGFPDVPFAERARGFTCVGRISPEKRIVEIIRILAAVRGLGHDVSLQIIGPFELRSYKRQVTAAAEPHRTWVSFHHDVPRDEMVQLVARNRYAIHGMLHEHFGIGPAEAQRAGCIIFVPDGGGACEIVGGDGRVIYHSIEDAIEKIDRVLRTPALEAELHRDVELRRMKFTEQRFMESILAAVDNFPPVGGGERPPRSD